MKQLNHHHLLDLALEVDFKNMLTIGKVASGVRQIAPIIGGKFSGEKLNGIVLEGKDWVIHQSDGKMLIDVRLTLKTDDGVYIYLKYQGHFSADTVAMAQFAQGALLDPAQYSLVISAQFECGDQRYNWLNNLITVGTGIQTLKGPIYSIFQIG